MAFAEVGLYWDFENVGIGAGFSMADLAALLTRVRGYGRLHESRLYYDSCKASSEGFLSKHRELVERLGVTLVDCPTSDKKEAIDKKIIVDCLVWALGRSSRLQPACVVLMSSDGDFAHMLSRLEQHGVRTIVIGRSAVLRTVCHTALTLREACSGADAKAGGEEGGGTEGGVAGDASGSGDHAPAAVSAASGTKRKRCGGSGAAAAAAASDAAAGSLKWEGTADDEHPLVESGEARSRKRKQRPSHAIRVERRALERDEAKKAAEAEKAAAEAAMAEATASTAVEGAVAGAASPEKAATKEEIEELRRLHN